MGRTSHQRSTTSPSHVSSNIQTLTKNSRTSSSSDENSPLGWQTNDITSDMYTWALPLESLVLNDPNIYLSLDFLQIYPSILRKFGGAPCDALGRTVTYFQSLFTESPAFHPYVMHLPFGHVPKTEDDGLIVAAALEKELIRIVQHLLTFFYGDVKGVVRYINSCPAELIPRPQFVIAEEHPPPNNGVEGYNNKHPGGQELWQNPIPPTSFWQLQEENDALRVNIASCADRIRRKRSSAVRSLVVATPSACPPQPPTTSSLKDDVSRIEAQMNRLFQLVSKG